MNSTLRREKDKIGKKGEINNCAVYEAKRFLFFLRMTSRQETLIKPSKATDVFLFLTLIIINVS